MLGVEMYISWKHYEDFILILFHDGFNGIVSRFLNFLHYPTLYLNEPSMWS